MLYCCRLESNKPKYFTGCSLEGLMLKLKLQYFGHLMRTVDSLEKTLMLGGIGGRRRRGRQRMRSWMASLIRWTWVWVNSRSWWWTGRPGELRYMELQRVGHDWETELNYSWLKTLVGGANYWNCISYLRENGMRLVSPNLVITGKLQSKVIIKNFRDIVNAAIISWEMIKPDVISVWG